MLAALGDEADLRHVHEELYGRGGLLSFEERVIDDILDMLEELEKDASSFAHIYLDAMNRSQTEYHLPRREVEILLTGYSIPLRAKVIDRLHELEEQAKGAAFRVPQSLPEALRLAAELTEQNEKLALENQEMAPKAVVFDNCVALRQQTLATFVRSFEGLNTMDSQSLLTAATRQHRSPLPPPPEPTPRA
nr:hypothetical protein [Pseudomonas otitidis]